MVTQLRLLKIHIELFITKLKYYKLNIDHSFVPKAGNNKVKIHFWGTHQWNTSTVNRKPFKITYDFYDEVTIK